MKLTVGPLPPAVYWRRRGVVLGALLLVVVFSVSLCSNGSDGSKKASGDASAGPSGSRAPSGDPSVLTPIIGLGGGDGQSEPAVTELTSAPPVVAPPGGGGQSSASGPCADTDISLTAAATPLAKGYYLSMKVKNTSTHACTRDLGGGPQALQVINASGTTVWSSDLCTAAGRSPQPDVRTFSPGVESVLPSSGRFYWDGTTGKCNGGTALPAGTYRLVAKLGTKSSDPVPLIGK